MDSDILSDNMVIQLSHEGAGDQTEKTVEDTSHG